MNGKDWAELAVWVLLALVCFATVGVALEPDPPIKTTCFATTTGSSCDDLEVWEP